MRGIQISRGCEEEEVKEFSVKTGSKKWHLLERSSRKSITCLCVSKHRGRCGREWWRVKNFSRYILMIRFSCLFPLYPVSSSLLT